MDIVSDRAKKYPLTMSTVKKLPFVERVYCFAPGFPAIGVFEAGGFPVQVVIWLLKSINRERAAPLTLAARVSIGL